MAQGERWTLKQNGKQALSARAQQKQATDLWHQSLNVFKSYLVKHGLTYFQLQI